MTKGVLIKSKNQVTFETPCTFHFLSESLKEVEEMRCYDVFDEAVKAIPTTKMWSMYVDFCIERLESGATIRTSNKVNKIVKDQIHTHFGF